MLTGGWKFAFGMNQGPQLVQRNLDLDFGQRGAVGFEQGLAGGQILSGSISTSPKRQSNGALITVLARSSFAWAKPAFFTASVASSDFLLLGNESQRILQFLDNLALGENISFLLVDLCRGNGVLLEQCLASLQVAFGQRQRRLFDLQRSPVIGFLHRKLFQLRRSLRNVGFKLGDRQLVFRRVDTQGAIPPL